MARGDQVAFNQMGEATGELVHDFDPTTGDTLQVALVSNQFSTLGEQNNLSQLTEVAGAGYTAGGEVTNITAFSRTGAVTQLQLSDVGWAQNGAGPTDIRTAVIYNASKVGQGDLINAIDITVDGTTPVSLQAGALNIDLSTNPPLVITRQ